MKAWNRRLVFLALLLNAFLLKAQPAAEPAFVVIPSDFQITSTETSDPSADLRGYGKVQPTYRTVTAADGTLYHVFAFHAADPAKACTVVGKFLADLTLSPAVTRGTLDIGGKKFSLVSVPGSSSYTGFVLGNVGWVISSENAPMLQRFLSGLPRAWTGVTTQFDYPPVLDRWDRYGWGFCCFSGEENIHNWKAFPGAGPDADPMDDLDFCGKYQFRFGLWGGAGPVGHFDDSYGAMVAQPSLYWEIAEAKKRNIPLHVRLYDVQTAPGKQLTDLLQQPAPFLEEGWWYDTLETRSSPLESWFNPMAQLYVARRTQNQMREFLDADKDIMSWELPYCEFPFTEWYSYQGDYSPPAVTDWQRTLRDDQRISLDEVSAMYARADRPFHSWDEVLPPEFATFAGLPGMVKDLEGDWSVRPETAKGQGETEQWWQADLTEPSWKTMHLPGAIEWFAYFQQPKWVARDFHLNPGDLARGTPVYLYSFARAINANWKNAMPLYLNGQKVGDSVTWDAWDVTSILKPDLNRIAFETDTFDGRIFLSKEKPAVFPHLGMERNRLWRIYDDWIRSGMVRSSEVVLSAMRAIDPVAPYELAAPAYLGPDRWIDLCRRFGTYPHYTSNSKVLYPWYKRFAFLYRIPSCSEGSLPTKTGKDQAIMVTRIFLSGVNSYNQAWYVQDVTRTPQVRQWYEDHITLMKQLGRYDISGPQVLIYSSSAADESFAFPAPPVGPLETPRALNWDLGRGTLQSIGQSPLYVADGGLKDGKLTGYPILMDRGNVVISADALQRIGDWVKSGGTYIVWPFTGKSSPDQPDGWPIDELTGCRVSSEREPGQGTVTIQAGQSLLQGWDNRSFPDAGHAKDWQGFDRNKLSIELQPGPDCEVIAKYEDGAAAVVVHHLGKGRVVTLGSAFFSQSQDGNGADLEASFFRNLFTGLGQPSPNFTDDSQVWTQRFRTNNGLDDVIVVANMSDQNRTTDITAQLDSPPTKVYCVVGNALNEITAYRRVGNSVILPDVEIQANDVQIFYLRDHGVFPSVQHWWAWQQGTWQPCSPLPVDLTPVKQGRWVDPVVNLKKDWKWTQVAPTDANWTQIGYDDSSWAAWYLDIFNAVGADATRPLYARKTFTVPPSWLADQGVTHLTAAGWAYSFTTGKGPWKLYLNGQLLEMPGFFRPDVSTLLKAGENVIALELDPPEKSKYIGVLGDVFLSHDQPPIKTVNLAGDWTGSCDGQPIAITLPGKGTCFWPSRKLLIPADWKDKYVVTYYAKGAPASTLGVVVNQSQARRRHHHLFGNEVEVDITPVLRFGEENTFVPFCTFPSLVGAREKPIDWDISQVELRLYPRDQYRD